MSGKKRPKERDTHREVQRARVGFLAPHLGLCAVGCGQGYRDSKTDMEIRPEGPEREWGKTSRDRVGEM